jgi:hypothetical protein
MNTIGSPIDALSNQLGNTVFEFLDAASEVWPECQALKMRLAEAKLACQNPETTKRYSAAFTHGVLAHTDLFERLLAKDLSVFESSEIPLIVELKVYEKMSSAPVDVQDTCWQYIEKIVQSANLNAVYSTAPSEIMSKVSEVAETLVKQIESGTFDPSTINPAELTQRMMEGMDPNAMARWASTAMNPSSINSLMGVMKNVMGKNGSPFDIASLMQGGGEQDMDLLKNMMGDMFKNLKK